MNVAWPNIFLLPKCTNGNKVENIKVLLIEQVQDGNCDLEGNGTGSYSANRKGYRKKK